MIRKLKITKWDTSKGVKEMILILKDGITFLGNSYRLVKKYSRDVMRRWTCAYRIISND